MSSQPHKSSMSRRHFLKHAAIAGSLTLANPLLNVVRADAPAQDQITLSFATSDALDAPRTKVIASILETFQDEHPNATVEIQPIPYDNFMQVLTTRIIGGQAPDTALLLDRWAPALMAQNALLPLDAYLPEGYGDAFNEVAWSFSVVDGVPYAIPYYTNVQSNIYNVDQFEAAGVTVPEDVSEAWKFAELVEGTQQVKEANGTDYGLIHWWASIPARLSMYLVAEGGSILNDDLTAPALNSQVAIDLLAQIQETFRSGLSPKDNWTQAAAESMFPLWYDGRASTIIASGNFHVIQVSQQVGDKFNWSFLFAPTTLGTPILVAGFDQTAHPEETATLLQFLTSPENMARNSVETVSIPTRTDIPAEALNFPAGSEQIQLLLQQLNVASPRIQAEMRHPAWSEIDLMLRGKLEQLALEQLTPEQVAEEGSIEIERLLERYAS
jgi:multiple sugar transport system substrate-binding protein